MTLLRSLLYAAIFYPVTVLWVLSGIIVLPLGRRPTLAVVLSWVRVHYRIAENILGLRSRIVGSFPTVPCLIAVKHESMYETLEMLRLSNLAVVVIKRELADMPFFGRLTRRYGVIPVERSAGAKALREMVAAGKEAVAAGRGVIIF